MKKGHVWLKKSEVVNKCLQIGRHSSKFGLRQVLLTFQECQESFLVDSKSSSVIEFLFIDRSLLLTTHQYLYLIARNKENLRDWDTSTWCDLALTFYVYLHTLLDILFETFITHGMRTCKRKPTKNRNRSSTIIWTKVNCGLKQWNLL